MEAAAVTDLSSERLKGEMWQQRKVHGNEGSASSFMEKDPLYGPESSYVEYSGLKEREDGGALDDGSRVGRGERVASFSSVIPGINGKTESLREASNPFGNLMNTGEVSNGAVISANTVGNVDASKLPGAISPTIVHEERKVNGKTSGSTGGRVAAGIVRGSNSSTDKIESSGVYGKTEEAGEATSYAPGATGVVSQHVVEGNNVGAAKDLPVVTNQAEIMNELNHKFSLVGAAKGQSGHGEGRDCS